MQREARHPVVVARGGEAAPEVGEALLGLDARQRQLGLARIVGQGGGETVGEQDLAAGQDSPAAAAHGTDDADARDGGADEQGDEKEQGEAAHRIPPGPKDNPPGGVVVSAGGNETLGTGVATNNGR